ncbi:MAG: hypothetical protein N3C62_04430 [Synergistetes bacterium]|nr:hypothetical protein [Synergistota bacterium]MCX8127960.1 hypothetical protein [Synergistota bacterium]MDW8191999.1 hypothetical protein [Synergistota bacterium]
MFFWLIVFFLSSLGVIGGGIALERVTEEWAERKGVTKEWAGFLILSIVTSSPELGVAISGALKGYSDMIVGNILGGNLFNIAVFSFFSFMWYDLFSCINRKVFIELISWSIAFTVVMIFALNFKLNLFWIFLVYPLIAFRIFERSDESKTLEERANERDFAIYFILSILVVFISSYFLIVAGGWLSRITSISDTFIGTLFIALVTSAPELSTSLAAILRKAHGLCLGNILGSNVLNFFILPIADLFFKGSMVSFSSNMHMFTVLSLLCVSLILVISTLFSVRYLRLLPVSIYLITIFILGKGV